MVADVYTITVMVARIYTTLVLVTEVCIFLVLATEMFKTLLLFLYRIVVMRTVKPFSLVLRNPLPLGKTRVFIQITGSDLTLWNVGVTYQVHGVAAGRLL